MDPVISDLNISDLAVSTAGRDQGELFYCIGGDSRYVLLADGKLSAHYENTILITDGEPEILTVTEGL